ncbi:PREDICTED: putative 1-phosphatidylinositol 3-phosphate 5-kinase [Papilio polytes]|uniref:putative 1-phosphatidylinositol 3-phosphate 5-kinase n=1 Tax=Papilio polytes TaxID=76194 RepID=UPI0006767AEF|nr:PREDICTED: putative 1-phosphatidylinositol 3-phosphate 5-kinase [Papilio polytes]
MVLEGCAEPHLGCCILLRGGSLAELARVKKVVRFMLLAFYNWKFEKAFLADIEAVLPEPGMSFGEPEANETDIQRESERQEKESLFSDVKEDDKSIDLKSENVDVIDDMDDSNIELFTNKTDTKSVTSDVLNEEVKNVKEDEMVHEVKSSRKTDGDKNLSCGVPIRDFSDPLRATLSMDDEVFLPKEEAELKADSHSERWCTDDAVLSMSPNIVIPAPRLPLRAPPAPAHTPRARRRPAPRAPRSHVVLQEPHPFIKMAISSPADDLRLRSALAHYRATGARVTNGTHKLHRTCTTQDYSDPTLWVYVHCRFVHGDASVTITCNTIGHSNLDKDKQDHSREVRYTFFSILNIDILIRICPHPLHAHAHAFLARLTTACFRYSKISMYDIQFPPEVISINYDTKRMRDNLIAQLNELMLKGHETFSGAGEGEEKEREYSAFRHHMDNIHLALTSASLHEHVTLASVVRNLWNVSDNIITGERMLREAQDKWSSPQNKSKLQPESNQEDKEADECNENAANDSSGTEEDEEKGDKKTVKQILSQLLSSNQQANQYYSTQNEQEDGENATGKEKSDGDKTKTSTKSNEHIEVLLKDGLACRVYFALQFHSLRHAVLAAPATTPTPAPTAPTTCSCHTKEKDGKNVCSVEEGFIRSLAQCVPWAARGGKSGSTFCKTEDDRYVLKEMTKPEWQQFLEFAPHYFAYVNSCRLSNQPSLLGKEFCNRMYKRRKPVLINKICLPSRNELNFASFYQ